MSSFVKLQNIFKVIIKEIVKAPLHQLSKLHLRYGESVLAAVLAIQSRSPHFSARTLRRGTVCYGAHRGPKRFRSAHARLELSNGLNLSSYIISVSVCVWERVRWKSQRPQGVAVTQLEDIRQTAVIITSTWAATYDITCAWMSFKQIPFLMFLFVLCVYLCLFISYILLFQCCVFVFFLKGLKVMFFLFFHWCVLLR